MVEWPTRSIADVVDFKNSRRIPLSARQRDSRKGRYPYYGASGIVDHVDDYLFDGTYLLISEDGENLRTRNTPIAFQVSGQFWVNNHAHILSEREPGILDYLEYAFSQFDLNPYITGAVQPKLNKRTLERIRLPIPDMDERLAINSTLNIVRDKIELNRQINKTLEAMAQAIFRDWFVDSGPTRRKIDGATDPVEIMGGLVSDPDRAQELAELFPTELGEDGLPEGWSEKPIGDLAEVVGGSTPSTKAEEYWDDGHHMWATPKDLSKQDDLFLFDTERQVTDAGLAKIGSGLSPVGTVLLSSRAPIGYLAIADVPTAVNQGFIAIRPSTKLPTSFALLWCQANMEKIKAAANGSTFQEISKRNFRPLTVVHTSQQVTNMFDGIVAPMFELMRSRAKENRTFAATRDLLLPKLMSGEIRLRDAERAIEAVA